MKEISNNELSQRVRKIRYVFTDVDGTLTDGSVYYNEKGESLKKFSLRDGTGFFLLHQANIKVGIITGEHSAIVEQRAQRLNVDSLILGAVPKVDSMRDFLCSEGLDFENIAYIGDDLNDIKLLEKAGLSFAVGDADARAKDVADIVCDNKGGCGAFREAVEKLLKYMNIDICQIVKNNL